MLSEATRPELIVKSAVLLSLNGVDVMLERWDGAIRRGEIRWDYGCYIAFDLEENRGVICLNGEEQEATLTFHRPVGFTYRLGEYVVRWLINNSNGVSVLTLLLLDDNETKAMLVVTVTDEQTGVKMCNSLLRCLNKLTTEKIITEGGKNNV